MTGGLPIDPVLGTWQIQYGLSALERIGHEALTIQRSWTSRRPSMRRPMSFSDPSIRGRDARATFRAPAIRRSISGARGASSTHVNVADLICGQLRQRPATGWRP